MVSISQESRCLGTFQGEDYDRLVAHQRELEFKLSEQNQRLCDANKRSKAERDELNSSLEDCYRDKQRMGANERETMQVFAESSFISSSHTLT